MEPHMSTEFITPCNNTKLDEGIINGVSLAKSQTTISSELGIIEPVKDRNYKLELLFFIYGIGVLLPYNATISTIPLIDDSLFPERLWPFIANVSFSTSLICGYFVLLVLTYHTNIAHRFLVAYLSIGISTVALMGLLVGCRNTITFFTAGQLVISLLGLATSIANGTTVGLSYLMGPLNASGLFLGQSFAGVVSFVTYIILTYTVVSPRTRIGIMLSVAAIWTSSCCLTYKWLLTSARVQTFCQKNDKQQTELPSNLSSNSFKGFPETQICIQRNAILLWNVFKVCWNPLMCVFTLFTVTSLLFPAMFAVLKPLPTSVVQNRNTLITILIATFQFGDVCGRLAVNFTHKLSLFLVWVVTLVRVLCIPFFILSQRIFPSAFICHLSTRILTILFLGITNGWCGSLSCIRVADKVTGSKAIEASGQLTSFVVVLAYTFGAWMSLLTQVSL